MGGTQQQQMQQQQQQRQQQQQQQQQPSSVAEMAQYWKKVALLRDKYRERMLHIYKAGLRCKLEVQA